MKAGGKQMQAGVLMLILAWLKHLIYSRQIPLPR
jgi:hypothetical protein